MEKLTKTLKIILCLLMGIGVVSCHKDDSVGFERESRTANVTVRIEDPSPLLSEPAGQNEGIKTLRLIVVNEQNEIEVNYYNDYSGVESNEKTVVLLGLSTGKKSFYVIANEESLGLSESDFSTIDYNNFDKVITDESKQYFPRLSSQIGDYGIPITGKTLDVAIEENTKEIQIEATHVVAKISLSFINNTSSDLHLAYISLGKFLAKKTSLFQNTSFETTDDYMDHQFTGSSTGVVIQPQSESNNEDLIIFYVYETDAAPENYTLYMDINETIVNTKSPKQFLDEKKILRNNWIKVTATINPIKLEDIQLYWIVEGWTSKNIDVPEFK